MENLLTENQNINIEQKELVEQVQAEVKVISNMEFKSKAYYNALGASAVEALLREKGLIKSDIFNIRSSARMLVDFEIADIQLSNLSLDVRVVFDEELLFIPKKHFECKLVPDLYLFVKFDEDLKNATILGCVEPAKINKRNQNEDYYFVNKSILSPISKLEELINTLPNKNQYVISETTEETLEKLIMLYMDNDIDNVKMEKLVDYLKNSVVAREKLIEFENFERLSYMALQEFKDLDVNNNDFSKYIKTLISTDEFNQFEESDAVETSGLSEEKKESIGLFFDEPEDVKANNAVEGNEFVTEDVKIEDPNEVQDIVETNDDVLGDEDDVAEIAVAPVVDEFDAFDVVDEFDMPETEETEERIENSVVNEDVVSDNLTEPLQGDDLELHAESLEGIEKELVNEEVLVDTETSLTETSDIVEDSVVVEELEVDAQAGEDIDVIEDVAPVVEIEEDDTSVDEIVNVEVENIQLEEDTVEIDEEQSIQEPEDVKVSDAVDEVKPELALEADDEELQYDEEIPDLILPEEPQEIIEGVEEESVEASVIEENIEIVDEVSEEIVEQQDEVVISEDDSVVQDLELPDLGSNEDLPEVALDEGVVDMEMPDIQVEPDLDIADIADVAETNVPEVNVEVDADEEIDMAGVVTDEISFEEESFDDISDVVEVSEEKKEDVIIEDVIETSENNGDDEFSIDDLMIDEIADDVQGENISNEQNIEMVSNEEVDAAIANAKFVDDDESIEAEEEVAGPKFVDDELDGLDDLELDSEEQVSSEDDYSLEDLLSMENDLEGVAEKSVEEDDSKAGVALAVPDADELEMSDEFSEINNEVQDENIEEADTEVSEGSDFAFAVDNKQASAQKNILLPIAALVTIIGLAGAGAWYFLSNGGKASSSGYDMADNSGVEDVSIDLNDVVPSEGDFTADIALSEDMSSQKSEATPAKNAEATKAETSKKQEPAKKEQVAKTPETKPVEAIKPIPEQLSMQKIKKDFSQPNTYLSVSKIVWDVPEYLTYNDQFNSYLQMLGSSVKLSLSSDLLLISENTLFNKVRVKIQLKDSGRKYSAELTDGCGAKVVDDLVLQSVKNTLNRLQPPVNSLDTADEDLYITIYL